MGLYLYAQDAWEPSHGGRPLSASQALVTEEANGVYCLRFTLIPGGDAAHCVPGAVVAAECPVRGEKSVQPFRIRERRTVNGREWRVYAEHLYFDALANAAAEPFRWQAEPLRSVCDQMSLLSGCVHFTCPAEHITVTGQYAGNAVRIARKLCDEKDLMLIRDGREAVLMPSDRAERGFTLTTRGEVTDWEYVQDAQGVRLTLDALPEALAGMRVFDTVLFRDDRTGVACRLRVNRTDWDPLMKRMKGIGLGKGVPVMTQKVFDAVPGSWQGEIGG